MQYRSYYTLEQSSDFLHCPVEYISYKRATLATRFKCFSTNRSQDNMEFPILVNGTLLLATSGSGQANGYLLFLWISANHGLICWLPSVTASNDCASPTFKQFWHEFSERQTFYPGKRENGGGALPNPSCDTSPLYSVRRLVYR